MKLPLKVLPFQSFDIDKARGSAEKWLSISAVSSHSDDRMHTAAMEKKGLSWDLLFSVVVIKTKWAIANANHLPLCRGVPSDVWRFQSDSNNAFANSVLAGG